jgi:hypothetical protein
LWDLPFVIIVIVILVLSIFATRGFCATGNSLLRQEMAKSMPGVQVVLGLVGVQIATPRWLVIL